MARRLDAHSAGRSKLVPFLRGESAQQRHDRRFASAIAGKDSLETWCQANSATLRVANNSEHWIVRMGAHVVEWWPRTAKLVHDKDWERGVHTHDVHQVIAQCARLRARWNGGDR